MTPSAAVPAGPAARPHVVITGGSAGIGAAIALIYAQRGASLALAARTLPRLEALAQDCRRLSPDGKGEVNIAALDVTDAAAMVAWLEATDARTPIDVVYANAGIGGGHVVAGPSGEDLATAAEIVAINLNGVLNTVVPILPSMVARGSGHLVLVSSLAAYTGLPQSPVYSATKAAVRVYGEGLRRLLRGAGVKVTVVSPGFVDTAMSRSLPMKPPGLWTVDEAARHIVSAVDRGRSEVAFPRHLHWLLKAGNILPNSVSDALMRMATRIGDRRG